MSTAIVMPKAGNTVEECLLSKWRIQVGEQVAIGQVIADIETDKSAIEVESTAEGTVLALFAQEGDLVPVLSNICAVGAAGEDYADLAPAGATPAAAEQAEPTVQATPKAVEPPPAPAAVGSAPLSPRARKFLEEQGLTLSALPPLSGSGAQGRIIEQDVRSAWEQSPRLSPVAASLAAAGQALPAAGSGLGGMILSGDMGSQAQTAAMPETAVPASAPAPGQVIEQPLSHIRKIIAGRLHESLSSMAQYTLCAEADVTGMLSLRERIKASREPLSLANINIGDMVMYAVIKALQKHPEMNGHFSDNVIRLHSAINIGFACDTPRGLMVPVLHNAAALSLGQMSNTVKNMAKQANEGKLNPDLLAGATFTVSNLGAFGITSFTPVINAPELAILGVGKTLLRAERGKNGEIEYRDFIQLSLTMNHMVIDGAPGARFLQTLKGIIENFELVCIAG